MTLRIFCTLGLVIVLVASSTLATVPRAAEATVMRKHSATQGGEVLIPGGKRFISSAARLSLAQTQNQASNQDFLVELARFLSAPMILDYAEKVGEMVLELRSLQEFTSQLDELYPGVIPRLADHN